MWVIAACGSALFAGLVAILGKLGVQTTDPDVATAVRTCVVLVLAWVAAACAGSLGSIGAIPSRTWLFLVLSGLATGGSWLCYYYAVQNGPVSVVAPVDKLSVLVSVILSYFIFGEKLSRRALLGLILLTAGTLALAIWG